ncbi:MBL fold metallo-hydrolase [Nocardia sp. NPDC058666]|uniref:MBL fold metallo-hydrolase n=1 Tax=Nocardia sp. NPDC058666 TaxID=3346587 RepID=UPI00365A0EE7
MVSVDRQYTGHVTPGGNAQQLDVPGARIVKMSVGPMDNNTYLIQSTDTGATVLIDAANDAESIIELTALETPGQVEQIVTTHRHPDHWQALTEVAKTLDVPTAAHTLDADHIPVRPDRRIEDGDTIAIGDLTLHVIHLRGHTPGSIALALTDTEGHTHLFTGDSLFPGGVGKTHSPADFDTLLSDVTTKLFDAYPDDTVVHPGHGDDTTLGADRADLPEWRARGW